MDDQTPAVIKNTTCIYLCGCVFGCLGLGNSTEFLLRLSGHLQLRLSVPFCLCLVVFLFSIDYLSRNIRVRGCESITCTISCSRNHIISTEFVPDGICTLHMTSSSLSFIIIPGPEFAVRSFVTLFGTGLPGWQVGEEPWSLSHWVSNEQGIQHEGTVAIICWKEIYNE